jgi:hypothetical protein
LTFLASELEHVWTRHFWHKTVANNIFFSLAMTPRHNKLERLPILIIFSIVYYLLLRLGRHTMVCSTQVATAMVADIRLGWKWQAGKNALDYYVMRINDEEKMFRKIVTTEGGGGRGGPEL